MFGREILIVNRIPKAAAGMGRKFFGYAGDPIGQNVVRFEKGPNNKIFLRSISSQSMQGLNFFNVHCSGQFKRTAH